MKFSIAVVWPVPLYKRVYNVIGTRHAYGTHQEPTQPGCHTRDRLLFSKPRLRI